MSRRRRASLQTRTSLAVGGVLTALVLTGCSVSNPITTHRDYAASDGVIVDVGDVRLGNALVLTSTEGAPGTLIGYVRNRSEADIQVWVGVGEGPGAQFALPAGATVHLGPDGDHAVDIPSVPAAPGSKVEVHVRSDRDGQATSIIPVLDGTLEEYADLVP